MTGKPNSHGGVAPALGMATGAACRDDAPAGAAAFPPPEDGGARSITLPWPPKSLFSNARVPRQVRAIATRQYRKAVANAAWDAGIDPVQAAGDTLAKVIFHAPSRRFDKDNCIGAFKAGQDGLAEAMGANDRTFDPDYDMADPVAAGAVVVIISEIPA